jgi:hypothetical protein
METCIQDHPLNNDTTSCMDYVSWRIEADYQVNTARCEDEKEFNLRYVVLYTWTQEGISTVYSRQR